jgi:hypothetical protein
MQLQLRLRNASVFNGCWLPDLTLSRDLTPSRTAFEFDLLLAVIERLVCFISDSQLSLSSIAEWLNSRRRSVF